jgi:dihydrofolate reductase
MTAYVYNTASSLDGFLADETDSLHWLLSQPIDEDGPGSIGAFMPSVGVLVLGSTPYEWVLDAEGGSWPYDVPTFVFTHRDLPAAADGVRIVSGDPAGHRAAIERAAGAKDVWLMGGGDLVGQFARAGMLDRVTVAFAPVTLGSGRPFLGAALDLDLVSLERNHGFVMATYDVVGPLAPPAAGA